MYKRLCFRILVVSFFICQTDGNECGELQEKFSQLEKEFSKLRQQVVDLEQNAGK
jgi:hypothetical protein